MDSTATPNESHAQEVANVEAIALEAGATAIGSIAADSAVAINKILELVNSKIKGAKSDYSVQINGRNIYKGALDGKGTRPVLSEKQQQVLNDAIYNPSNMKGTLRIRAKGVEKPVFEMIDGKVTRNELSIEISAPTINLPNPEITQLIEKAVTQGVAENLVAKKPVVTNEDLMEAIKQLSEKVRSLEQRLEPPKTASQKIEQWFSQTRNQVSEKVHGLADKVHAFADKISVEELKPIIDNAIAKGWERHNQSVEQGWNRHAKALDDYAESLEPFQPVEAVVVEPPRVEQNISAINATDPVAQVDYLPSVPDVVLLDQVKTFWNPKPTDMHKEVLRMAIATPEAQQLKVDAGHAPDLEIEVDVAHQIEPSISTGKAQKLDAPSENIDSTIAEVKGISRPTVQEHYLNTEIYPQIRSAIEQYSQVPNAVTILKDGTKQYQSQKYTFNDKPDGEIEIYRKETGELVSPENLTKIDRKVFNAIAKKLDKDFGPLNQRIYEPNVAKGNKIEFKQKPAMAAVALPVLSTPKIKQKGFNP
jgi:hypothetical protein